MTMQDLSIDFGELEVETWEDELEEDLRSNFAHSSSKVLTSSLRQITNDSPFLDYSSFLLYMSAYKIEIIPESDLKRVSRLGFGATMTVFKGTCPSRWGDTEVAFKRLNLELPRTKSTLHPNSEELYHLMAAASLEIRVLSHSSLRYHPNIVDLLAVSWEELGEEEVQSIRPILIVELACPQYPTLDEYYNYSAQEGIPVDLDTKVSILSDIADALSAVHFCGVIHGDIKPQNILMFRNGPNEPLTAKLADFGGCQPPVEEDKEAAKTSMHEFSVLGTEYWNAPEVLGVKEGQPDLLSRKATRDYYSMGMLVYYVLFEEMLFGDDQDNSDQNLERITEVKNNPLQVQELVRRKMATCWPVSGRGESLKGLSDMLPRPSDRLEFIRKLYTNRKTTGSFPQDTRLNGKCRQYALYYVIRLFLHHDPEARQRGDIMSELRQLLGDDMVSRAFRDLYLMGDWEYLQSGIENSVIQVWDFSNLRGAAAGTEAPHKYRIHLRSNQVDLNETRKSIDLDNMDNIVKIPFSLRTAFLQELNSRARDTGDPQRISSLLALEYCGCLGFCEGYEPLQYAFEAAQLGSTAGKFAVIGEPKMMQVEPRMRCAWMLDYLLESMPSKDTFTKTFFDASHNFTFLGKLLFMDFRTYAYEYRDMKKILEVDCGDPEVGKLFSEAISGQATSIKTLLGDNKEYITAKVNGYNLLHAASEYGNNQLIQVLVNGFGMDIDELNDGGVSPVVLAARANRFDTVSTLIQLGADAKRLLCARTLRQLASYCKHSPIKFLYIIAKAFTSYMPEESFSTNSFLDGNFTAYPDDEPDDDEPDFPPIFSAILGSNIIAFWTLLDLGCSRDIYTEFSSGPLAPIHLAANLRPLFLAILLHYGALPDLRTRDRQQSTALHLVCVSHRMPTYNHHRLVIKRTPTHNFEELQPPDILDIKLFMIQLLVKEYGADVNAQNWYGMTAISHCISGSDSLALAQYLAEDCDANIHIKDFHGLSCLHRATTKGTIENIEFCMKHGIDVNEKDLNGFTPLFMAVCYSTVEACQYLLDHGADLLATDNRGWTCLDIAIRDRHTEITECLFKAAEQRQLLPTLISGEDQISHTIIHKIISDGIDTSSTYLPRFAKADISRVLENPDTVGYTILHHAVLAGNIFAIEYLLQLGANVNAKGWRGLSPLHVAYGIGNPSVIEILEKAENIDLGCFDTAGRTPGAFWKLSAASPDFWPEHIRLCNEDGEQRKRKYDINITAIEAENRRKGAPKDGWFST